MRTYEYLLLCILSKNREDIIRYKDAWASRIDPNELDIRTIRLMPLFYDHLKEKNIEIPYPEKLDYLHKYWWLRSVNRKKLMDTLTMKLEQNKIRFCYIKGSALLSLYSREFHRTSADIDIVVHKDDLLKTCDVLRNSGISYVKKHLFFVKYFYKIYAAIYPEILFYQKKPFIEIDLHFRFSSYFPESYHRKLWAQSVHSNDYTSNLELQFILVCINGYYSMGDQLNWIIDAVKILEKHPEISFARIEEYIHDIKINNDWIEATSFLSKYTDLIQPSGIETLKNFRKATIISYRPKGNRNTLKSRFIKIKNHLDYCYYTYYLNHGTYSTVLFFKHFIIFTIHQFISISYNLFKKSGKNDSHWSVVE